MKKINYALIVVSKNLQTLVSSMLTQNDILFSSPMIQEEKKFLYPYVTENINSLSTFDAVIIELASLADADSEIMDAIEAVRFLDDNMRIVIIGDFKINRFPLLNQCFLNGIYNIVCADSYIDIKKQLAACLQSEGMSYKDALVYRNEESFKKRMIENKGNVTKVAGEKRNIVFTGIRQRMGVTHCTLSGAYTLRKCGYIVAVVDFTGTADYTRLVQSRDLQPADKGCYTIDEIDIYIQPDLNACTFEGYNFVLYDFGSGDGALQQVEEIEAEKILVCGSKSWELPDLAKIVKDICLKGSQEKYSYLFSFTITEMKQNLEKLLKAAGIDKGIHIMEYLPDPFMESETLRSLFGVTKKKGIFSRKR